MDPDLWSSRGEFVCNDTIAATTGLPSISETISCRCNALFGHVARLPDDVPAHKVLNCQVNLSLGRPLSSQWHRRPGRPHNRWVDQIQNDNNLRVSGGALSVVVIAEQRYGPCRLSNDNNNNNNICYSCKTKLLKMSHLT